jgi:hypothetical protein
MKILDTLDVHGKELFIPKLHDRAYIQIGLAFVGVLSRTGPNRIVINLPNNINDTLFIIVENMGRLNFGDDTLDNKGILSGVLLNGRVLGNWRTCLTQNFIPNYRAKVNDDLVARYKVEDHLLTLEQLKYLFFQKILCCDKVKIEYF